MVVGLPGPIIDGRAIWKGPILSKRPKGQSHFLLKKSSEPPLNSINERRHQGKEVPNKRTRPQGNFSWMNSHVSMAGFALGRSFSDPAPLKHQKSGLMGRM